MRILMILLLATLLSIPASALALVAVDTEPATEYIGTVSPTPPGGSGQPAQVQSPPSQSKPGKNGINATPKPQKKGQGAAPKQ